jgi:hypothetical protein
LWLRLILPLIQWLRKPSKIHIILDFWLGWRHFSISNQRWLGVQWYRGQLGCMFSLV